MDIKIHNSAKETSIAAALEGAKQINECLLRQDQANILLATGASQIQMLKHLVTLDIDWSRINCFHMDEYIDMPITDKASFRKYLKERFEDFTNPRNFFYINGQNNALKECERVGTLMKNHPLDVAFIGIGENAHLAFNDPPADFETKNAYAVVELDDRCRQQQFGEGWFETLEDVPKIAISITINQIMKA